MARRKERRPAVKSASVDLFRQENARANAPTSSPADDARRLIKQVFSTLREDAFRFPEGIARKLKLRENA